jgi:uroporphyrinogen decarboxylase
METLTGKERIARVLKRRPADRIGLFEEFWDDTLASWKEHIDPDGMVILPNGRLLDMEKAWPFNFTADVFFREKTVGETAETILLLDGNGALLRKHKLHVSTPEHVGFRCDRDAWFDEFRPMLLSMAGRIDFAGHARSMDRSKRNSSFLLCGSWNVFQVMVNLVGHENLLVAMALDPEWVKDMIRVYSELAVNLHESLFETCGPPDGLFIMEDLGYFQRTFMSQAMFREFIKPAYRRICDFAKSRKLPVLFHSCGFMEPFIPDLIDAGIDCLTAMEVKAGMDVARLFATYGDRLSFMGGIDTRVLCTNDQALIEAELQGKVLLLKSGNGYILSSDHSIPDTVKYETYCWFVERGLELGKTL